MASGRFADYLGMGVIADRPAAPVLLSYMVGLWYSTDTNEWSAWDGSVWLEDIMGGAGMTNPMTTAEDIIVGGVAGAPARLGVGANGTFLGVTAGVVGWASPSGSGDVVGPASSTADYVVLFDGTTGKLLKQGAGTLGTAAYTAATDYQPIDGDLTTIAGLTATTDNFLQSKSSAWASRTVAQVSVDLQATGLIVDAVGFRTIPQNSQSAAYTAVAADSGKHILHPSADTTARIFTIPANASVAYPVGTALTFVNQNAAGVITIAITTDTMRLAGTGTTGSRTLAANGIATAIKITSTEWIISGTGLT